MRKPHADLLVKRGKLRIGTLYEYRDMDKHGYHVGDDGEGKKSLYMDVKSEDWTPDTQPDFAKGLIGIGSGISVHMENVLFERPENSPDYYLYCATQEFDETALQDFGYNSCVVIRNPNEFFAAITRKLRHRGIFEGIFPCQYLPRRVEHDKDHGIHPAVIKDPRYRNQKEVRALWRPFKKNICPLIIDCQEAAKHCRLL